jgi:hypothetical protein
MVAAWLETKISQDAKPKIFHESKSGDANRPEI